MQKQLLVESTAAYHKALPGSLAEEFLANRSLMATQAIRAETEKFRLGYVADPVPGHDQYRGMLAIPYIRTSETGAWSVVSIRFRCLEDHEHVGHGKYNTTPGDRPRLFNTRALMTASDTVAIVEGEIDAVTMSAVGPGTVGVPGAQSWRPWFREPFLGYQTVYVISDGDEPGTRFANTVATTLPNAKVVPCPAGEDTNSMATSGRINEILERLQ